MNTIRARLEAEQAELQKVCIDQLLLSLLKKSSSDWPSRGSPSLSQRLKFDLIAQTSQLTD
jgi:hypothetical protein